MGQNEEMCGIAGYIAPGDPETAETRARSMTDALSRRGPDSSGIASWPDVVLGHRRLAILDLSPAGHQPMISEDGEIGLVFNGCIYNFLELRRELEDRGHAFRSHTDTEVLLAGYREWGIEALARRLRGMFAFAIWDEPRRKLTLVRDRLGVKPLVWWAQNGELAFASTLEALHAAGLGGQTDEEAVLEFLEYGFVTDERCIWRGFHKLPPATILEWSGGKVREQTYWTLDQSERNDIGFEDAVVETERLIVESVRLRLCADVPIGALLSGGIDSGLVCWAMAQANAQIRAFTVGTPGDPSDESEAAWKTATQLGIRHEVVELPETGPMLDTLVAGFSEPFASQSALALLRVAQAIKPHATVLLTGDGGDDVFFGYPFFKNAWMAQRFSRSLPSGSGQVWSALRGLVPAAGPLRRMRSFLDFSTGGLGAYARVHDGLPYFEQHSLLGERLRPKQLDQRHIPVSLDSARRLLPDVFAFHRKMHFTSEFMPKVDGATMYYALEARSPFLDQKLWEFAARLPAGVRLHDGTLKAVPREIARRRLGADVADRKKQGFTVPAERWLAQKWLPAMAALEGTTRLEQEGWIRPGVLGPVVKNAVREQWVPHQLWFLLVLEHWLQKND
jgi:asparagine synthase (glutamine-hydrolysing)